MLALEILSLSGRMVYTSRTHPLRFSIPGYAFLSCILGRAGAVWIFCYCGNKSLFTDGMAVSPQKVVLNENKNLFNPLRPGPCPCRVKLEPP